MSENELIAEFMKMPKVSGMYEKCDAFELYTLDEFRFKTSWDWLMPVVNNIESIVAEPNASVMVGWDHWNNQFDGTINTDIRVTYQIVVEFIKWYNQHKQ